ncbi:uncharacterized protein LOC9322890 [Arabidopsis lyrata subsp. lyrata]|uniref:uncharacterized protein LOC9322890 n=1 Tax=Arabidopsis lyrata subsp. lyrata TaxID=81972 RepID=UPI000A29D8F6|nr:uncharacterized protein LOC9322890 [Arabidopsis lyrata subsp. lyrata]|eukprot:XP_020890968.1 uncharacterized protein LOC9322890 [Arabidopsis lyrata subsp. lyrata]
MLINFSLIKVFNSSYLRSAPLLGFSSFDRIRRRSQREREIEKWLWLWVEQCPAYPEKFYAAASYIALEGFDSSTNDTALILYKLLLDHSKWKRLLLDLVYGAKQMKKGRIFVVDIIRRCLCSYSLSLPYFFSSNPI